jgi:pteridine reductase
MSPNPRIDLPPGLRGDRPVALVTGGARRVGRAVCLAMASRGLDVVLTRRRSAAEAERTAADVRALGVEACTLELDLAEPEGVRSAGREIAEALPRLDVLVHNASTYEPSPLGAIDLDAARRQVHVCALSPLVLTEALADALSASPMRGGGAVVAMLDIHTEGLPRPDHAAYTMAKAALGGLVRALAVDLAPTVRVNAVAPGVVAWPEEGPEADPDAQRRYLRRVPLDRSGTPEEAARAVVFLALDATYTTGQVVRVDGGRALR